MDDGLRLTVLWPCTTKLALYIGLGVLGSLIVCSNRHPNMFVDGGKVSLVDNRPSVSFLKAGKFVEEGRF